MQDVLTPEFDVSHAILLEKPLQETMIVRQTAALSDALRQGTVLPNAQVLVSEFPDQALVFETWHLLAHPIAEGDWKDIPYAAAFCAICNSGVMFNTQVGDTRYHFTQGGLYNGMMIMRDTETGSYWNHVTGECLHGPLKGAQLQRLNTLLFMTARQAAVAYPNAVFAREHIAPAAEAAARSRDIPRLQPTPDYGSRAGQAVVFSLGSTEDARLPRFEMGLGVWTDKTARYYTLQALRASGGVILDQLAGRTVLVYIDPQSMTPTALYVTSGSARWDGEIIRLDNGVSVQDGVIIDRDGQLQSAEHPNQLFQRWMGFSATFPTCQIYGR